MVLQGYTDPKATAKKVMTDVFVKGDKYFRTGDLLMRDSNGCGNRTRHYQAPKLAAL